MGKHYKCDFCEYDYGPIKKPSEACKTCKNCSNFKVKQRMHCIQQQRYEQLKKEEADANDNSIKFDRRTALMVLKDLAKFMRPSFGNKTLVIDRYKFELVRKKYLDKKKKIRSKKMKEQMNKEKQIEEMAKDWCKYRFCRELFCRPYNQKACELEMRFVNKLIELGYEKITENEVVISKEEYEELLKLQKTYVEDLTYARTSFEEEKEDFKLNYDNHIKNLEKIIDRQSKDLNSQADRLIDLKAELENKGKETAEKIYTFVNSFGTHNWERFKEFIKQFGVDLGDNK